MRVTLLSVRLYLLFAAALILLFLGASRSPAQDNPNLQNGLVPFGSFDGGNIDSVNVFNGNLNIHIPLFNYPQRGSLPGQLMITGNTKAFFVVQSCNTKLQTCTLRWNIRTPGVQIAQVSDSVQLEAGQRFTSDNGIHVVSWDGSSHQMWNQQSLDGTGIFINKALPPTEFLNKNGNGIPSTSNSITQQDTNGNYFTTSGTDTLGRTITSFPGPNGTTTQVQITSANVTIQTNFQASGTDMYQNLDPITEYGPVNVNLVQSIAIYNGTSWATSPTWTFQYNDRNPGDPSNINYGNVTQITLPTGGTISYTYGMFGACGNTAALTPVSRGVISRTVNANDGTGPHTTSYNLSVVTDPLGNDTVHAFTGLGGSCSFYETETQYYQGSSSTGHLLKTVQTSYAYKNNPNGVNNTDDAQTVVSVVPTTVTTTLDNGLVNQVVNTWDHQTGSGYTYGNLLEKDEYDFGNGAPGPLLRKTVYTYLAFDNSSYFALNMLDRVDSVTVYDGNGNQVSKTTYGYDETGLVTSGISTNHQSAPGGSLRGNQTSVCRWLNTTGANLCTHTSYYDTGMPYQVTDPLGNVTTYSYSSTYAGAYVTQTTMPQTGSVHHVISGAYDFDTGLLTSFTDQNSQATAYQYDPLWRPTTVSYPDQGQTTFSYPNPNTISTSQKITSTQTETTTSLFDGLGRVSETQLNSDPDCTTSDKTDTTYDALSRVATASNPYCSTSDPTYGITTYAYDALGRTTQVTHPDSNTILTSYTGRATQVQDEGNGTRRVTRISQADGLGRLASVCEVTSASQLGSTGTPAACGQDISATGFLTTYSYNTIDNLTSVSQSGLNSRSFQYDSLSRLTSSTNPESGTTGYTYDNNGNVLTKTDARSIKITYSYDALNRLTGKTYSDGTPAATLNYDQSSALGVTLTNTIGRESSETTAGALPTGSVFSYDSMGRIADNSQCTPQNCGTSVFAIQYPQYDLLGDLVSATNAAGVTFSYSYNGAARLTSMSSNFTDPTHPGTLLSQATYYAPGLPKTVLLGNGVTETRNYDSRLRLTSLTAGTLYSLNMGSYAPNSDLLAANDSVNGNWTYSYDDFNRLSGSNQNSGQSVYSYVYDRFGNRWQQNGQHPMQLSFSGANNRMDGYSYDAAGNLLSDGSHSYFYDAENRLIQVDGTLGNCSMATACYVYDAEGRRVRKATASGTLDFLYDAQGHKVAEVDTTGTFQRGELYAGSRHLAVYAPDPGPTGATFFIHPDWLGTERARTNVSGTVCEAITSLPFGDGQTITDTCGDSAGDVSPTHFTGKPRDTESNLDYFGARYNSSSFGRFMSPDPGNVGVNRLNPQTWNAFSYSLNNPLNLTDPTGLYVCEDSTECDSENDQKFAASLQAARDAANSLTGDDKAAALRAVDAYGEKGVDNGVNVRFDANIKDGDAVTEVSGVANGNKSADNPTGQNINVTFKPGAVGGDFSGGLVAHEGSHVADASAWVASGFSPNLNPTRFTTEFNANHVEFDIANALLNMKAGPDRTYTGFINVGHGQVNWKKGDTFKAITPDLQQKIRENFQNPDSPAFRKGAVLQP